MSCRRLCVILKYIGIIFLLMIAIDFSGVIKHCLELSFLSEFHYPKHGEVLYWAHQLQLNAVGVSPINAYNFTMIGPDQKCSENLAPDAFGVLVLIKSALNHFKRRDVIRKTWGLEYKSGYDSVLSVFLLGNSTDENSRKQIQSESNQFKDIVIADFIDSYFNNTIKTMMGFRWAVQYCKNVTHYFFVDDDYYVSMKNVLRYIRDPDTYPTNIKDSYNYWQSKRDKGFRNIELNHFKQKTEIHPEAQHKNAKVLNKLYAGFMLNSSPHRHKSSKWYIPLSEYPFDKWPAYITAGAYVLSNDALFEMYFVSMYTKHFRFDDIYLSILALKAKISLTHSSEFYLQKAKYLKPQDYKNVIATHGYEDPEMLFNTWLECYAAGYA